MYMYFTLFFQYCQSRREENILATHSLVDIFRPNECIHILIIYNQENTRFKGENLPDGLGQGAMRIKVTFTN